MQEMCWINFNMGCFEIGKQYKCTISRRKINFNMGCFEIVWVKEDVVEDNRINFNMGCFEIAERRRSNEKN